MIIFKEAAALARHLQKQRTMQRKTGFIPTMGALHEGHLALVQEARQHTSITVCSIFVNPTQFNDPNDYKKYPNTLDKDIYQLEKTGTDILFLPSVDEMYPHSIHGLEHYDLGYLETVLEGQYRPGHFQGVCQVMSRLLQKVQPDELFMGQKDYQQCMVVQWLLQHLKMNTRFVAVPTIREKDGLAMSSRNMRLPEADRKKAPAIYHALEHIRRHITPGSLTPLLQEARDLLEKEGFKIDYVAVADAHSLSPTDTWDGKQPLVALIAAFLGEVRLIDNRQVTK
ncbi:pantoate--beta-alanine ligase [Pseudoflavitalea sp. X16]|uniref:pantoate--beta-alanine ligase n=1 Tax=Paraflavitalea devenefica TaxID=2716334 RepID=UPI0014218FA4|nr:pantoate--beta-alanine ligase [Paraflavitalea devenefica]NII26764.1 pantoate--beta-alanine ligase [Paraflavitalea devenefica]